MKKLPPKHSQFQPGTSGNPRGRPVGSLGAELRKLLLKELHRVDPKTKKSVLLRIVLKLLSQAIKGDISSVQILFDRAFGKVSQQVDIDLELDLESPIVKILKMTSQERTLYINELKLKIESENGNS